MKWLSIHFRLWTIKTSYLFIMLKSFTISQVTTNKILSLHKHIALLLNVMIYSCSLLWTSANNYAGYYWNSLSCIQFAAVSYICANNQSALPLPPFYFLSLSLSSVDLSQSSCAWVSRYRLAHTKSHISKSKSKFNLWSRVASSVKPMTQWGRVAKGR